ncbi:MAG: hypothetical protein OXR64_02240 [Chloroflexota bacterium]|nr:hypothetical protein [Chloroflexota bacterium]
MSAPKSRRVASSLGRRTLLSGATLTAAAVALAACGFAGVSRRDPTDAPFMHGLTLAGLSGTDFAQQRAGRLVESSAATGADWVSIAPGWYQATSDASHISPDSARTPPDGDIRQLIDQAHAAGLRVMLKPFVNTDDGVWRGDIRPADLATWFADYTLMTQRYADLAAQGDADLLCLGTDLGFSEAARAEDWRKLIADVRGRFSGPLTYAASHAPSAKLGGYADVPFWDDLDFIGINAYFPLADRQISHAQLADAWNVWLDEIEQWRKRKGLDIPVLFTELGYRSAATAASQPRAADPVKPHEVDSDLQANLYTAFFGLPYRREALQGVFWWRWDPDSTDAKDSAFPPNGKPAEAVLRRAYTAAGRRPSYSASSSADSP